MKKLILASILATAAYGGWRWHSAPVEGSGPALAFNRVWIDHMPTSDRDTFHVFIASRPESVGGFAEETVWRGQIERFRFEAEGDQIRAVFPWSGEREDIIVKATRCDEAGMDFCLQLIGSKHGVSHYYSRNGWERRDADDPSALPPELRRFEHASR